MTLDLQTLAIFAVCAAVYLFLLPAKWRDWGIFSLSIISVYALQPQLPIRFAGFILPTAVLGLTCIVWWVTSPKEQTIQERWAQNKSTIFALLTLITLLAVTRYLPLDWRPLVNRPPAPTLIIPLLIGILMFGFTAAYATKKSQPTGLAIMFGLIVILFALLKSEFLATAVARLWRGFTQQDTALAAPLDWQWIGYSYIAFRLIHILRDRQTNQLPPISLRESISYVLFFPAFIAGPIDRAERFQKDWLSLASKTLITPQQLGEAGRRITLGLAQKFIIADSLAQGMSLNPALAQQTESRLWLWILLYGYGLRLYFDFAGYSNMAIGLGQLFGIDLPDNFRTPYLKTNITTFWQSWHMTLSSWARSYVFSPLSRSLLRRKPRPSPYLIVLVSQLATMILIGLWHGITINYLIWGIWHGLALFVHKQWSDRTRKWYRGLKEQPTKLRAWQSFAWFLTFHYVMLGWIWFLLPSFQLAWQTIGRLLFFL